MIKKNKKHILIGVCALAGVALTSVGFATWVVGVQKTNEDLKLNVEVDSVQSDTKFLSATLPADAKLTIAERTEVNKTVKQIVGTKKNGTGGIAVSENALKFSFASITINMGKEVDTKSYPTTLTLKLDNTKTENAINKVADSAVRFDETEVTDKREKGDGYTYLAYTKIIDLKFQGHDGVTEPNMIKQAGDETKPYYTFKLADNLLAQEFTWGSLFGTAANTTPTAFYNSIPAESATLDELLAASEKAYGEIDAMYKVFSADGASLTISASIN